MAEAATICQKGMYFKDLDEEKKPEVFFKGHHVTHHPWEKCSEWEDIPIHPGHYRVPYQNNEVDVVKLCHVTHNKEFKEIRRDNCGIVEYVLKPRQKFGKAGYDYDGAPIGESYVICEPSDDPPNHETRYQYISKDEEVLPGYYIWWSIDPSCIHKRPYSEMRHTTGSKEYTYKTSEPFCVQIQSRYGNHKITSYIMQLLQCYQSAYGSPLPRIEFRCGGTLRYRYEICRVVIVCAVFPDKKHPLSKTEYPPMLEDLEIQYRKSDGKVVFVKPPRLKICNGISGVYYRCVDDKNPESYSWDTYAFALHFPNETFTLELPEGSKISHETIAHGKKCLKTKPNPSNYNKFTCPNDLPN